MKKPFTSALAALAITVGGAVALPTMAQDRPTAPGVERTADDGRDYGWIGLLGLIGLAGLMGRKRDDTYDTRRTTATR